jgi:hypothetical protein
LERSLQDEIPGTRQSASECMVLFKVPSASDDLKKAIAIEKDEPTRVRMLESLQR